MKSSGTAVAVALFGVLGAFFVYQWWFNPTREVQRRLNAIAATLSMPDQEPPAARARRAAALRQYLAEDIQLRAGARAPASRDAIIGAVAAFPPPPGGWNVQFVDLQIRVDRSTNASADVNMTVEINGRDPRTGQPTQDSSGATVTMRKQDGAWVVATATLGDARQR